MNRVFEVNSPAVVGEILDGEAVIMNLKTGNYFSTDSVGSVLWAMIEKGASYGSMLATLNQRYDAEAEQIATAIDGFLDDLLANELVRAAGEDASASAVDFEDAGLAGLNGHGNFVAPVLNVYSDMQDLLLLDPIHDVDEGGWPSPRQSDGDE